MDGSPDYKRILEELNLAHRLASSDRTDSLERLLHGLEEKCTEELERIRGDLDAAEHELEQLGREIKQGKANEQDLRGKLSEAERQLDDAKGQIERSRKRSQRTIRTFAVILLATITITATIALLGSGRIESEHPTSTATLTPIPCSHLDIKGLELRSTSPDSITVVIPPGGVLTTTISSFSLHPQTESGFNTLTCEFVWSVFYGSHVVTFIAAEFTSDRTESVDGEEVLLLEESKYQLVLSVAPFDKSEQLTGNLKPFRIVVSECPYSG